MKYTITLNQPLEVINYLVDKESKKTEDKIIDYRKRG